MNHSVRFVVSASVKSTTVKQQKLILVLFKTGYDRIRKTLPHSIRNTKKWDKQTQRLKNTDSSAVVVNSLLDAMQRDLEKQIVLWEEAGYDWTPKELLNTLDDNKPKESQKSLNAQNSVIYWIDYQIEYFNSKKRFKNGEIIIGSSNSKNYQWLRNFLFDFTLSEYKKDFTHYQFKDITESFLQNFVFYIKKKGHSQGNNAGLSHKLKNFKAVFNIASSKGCIKDANSNIFSCVKGDMKLGQTTPKTTSKANVHLIKNFDRTQLSQKECFWLDLFLFSYYTGGMSNVDVCYLNHSCMYETHFQYTRQKCDKVGNPALLPQALEIIERYSKDTYTNYVFPIFNHKQQTELQKRQKVERMTSKVNATLRKVCAILDITDKITWYSSRGSYATNAIDADINPHTVADQAGNSVKVIEQYYFKVTNRRGMLEKISAAL